MSDLTNIKFKPRWHKRKMKLGGEIFEAAKTEGGGWYCIKEPNGHKYRHTANIVEDLSEEVPDGDRKTE